MYVWIHYYATTEFLKIMMSAVALWRWRYINATGMPCRSEVQFEWSDEREKTEKCRGKSGKPIFATKGINFPLALKTNKKVVQFCDQLLYIMFNSSYQAVYKFASILEANLFRSIFIWIRLHLGSNFHIELVPHFRNRL